MKLDGKKTHWHDGHKKPMKPGVLENYKTYFNHAANEIKRKTDIEVINLNPDSALDCFPKKDYREVMRLTVSNKNIRTVPEDKKSPAEARAKKPSVSKDIKSRIGNSFVTAITPTGDRPLPFALCQKWMMNQTLQPDQWIIVDDGKTPTMPIVSGSNIFYVRRKPQPSDPQYTLLLNLKMALPLIKGNKVMIIEDDEYYAPKYIETMAARLDEHEIVGIGKSKYYHLLSGHYAQIGNVHHASFAEMAFRSSFLPEFINFLDGGLYLDMRIWRSINRNRTCLFFDDGKSIYVGMKGMPGRHGIGGGHDINHRIYRNQLHDSSRAMLKKWIPDNDDYKIYMDIISGKLTEENYKSKMNLLYSVKDITGITVCYNTKDLIARAYNSVRKFHPNIPIIIIDGSDSNNSCATYVKTLASSLTIVKSLGYNIGHGRGMHMGIGLVKTKYALIFDSDTEMLKSPVNQMMKMMEEDTFGVGYIEKTDFGGYEYGVRPQHTKQGLMLYLHPYFQLINIKNYHKFHPYVHHGAPCHLTMLDIHNRGLSNKILKNFPSLGHSAGKGFNWEGVPREYIRHDVQGTRKYRVQHGLPAIEGGWIHKLKTIAFLTRVHPNRPNMLKICIDSIKKQTNDDYIHILSRDDKTENGYGRFMANKSFAKISPINVRYVMTIDDDDMLIDPNFVKIFKETINKNNPEIVFFKGYIGDRLYPWPGFWKKAPARARIASFCFAIRLDVWKKYIHEFGKKACGDFSFISACYRNTKNHVWLDRIVAKTQRKAGFGRGEYEHA